MKLQGVLSKKKAIPKASYCVILCIQYWYGKIRKAEDGFVVDKDQDRREKKQREVGMVMESRQDGSL